MVKKVLTIAGSDPLAAGGLQADLATFSEYGLFGLAAITSIVTNVQHDFKIYPTEVQQLDEQLATIFALPDLEGIKLGLLPTVELIELVGQYLKESPTKLVVFDPVLIFKEANQLDLADLVQAMRTNIFPYADVITPNLSEAALLANRPVPTTPTGLLSLAQQIQSDFNGSVVIKGGKRLAGTEAIDLLLDSEQNVHYFEKTMLNAVTVNGAGCTFAAAITANLSLGLNLLGAVEDAKDFVYQGIQAGVPIETNLGNVWQGARRYKQR
ncbi:phosphomethylpyrimidine kinase [Weissella oryzae SG25]|uniref:pyridoxal kinase n=1 Tax=Weissella oryzae (strain DSM 25784 / JCM 18191 / LMG 30913 / SG25) TaxID=1329250 RepID=A0A069CRT9_WEIOS|nr:hydroxymethylpyrimidine/phosphomethylpyrimidine kinase [Weissella oryzae]GAK30505.1 phosphomethylpyrimidine kinase [Weissella oryzae SG25]